MEPMRKYIAITLTSLAVVIGASSFLSACNTVEGAGQDVSHAGHAVSKAADENK
jgi:predicted small secreted protein